jgi:transposase
VVCSDLYSGFIGAAKEVFGKKVMIVADRFHIAKLYRKALDSLRIKEMKKLKKALSQKKYHELKNVMWILRKNSANLSDDEIKILQLLFKYSPILKDAYYLCVDLTEIFNSLISKGQAKRKIKGWIKRTKTSNLNCFDSFIKTLLRYMEEITNYFVGRNSSGLVERLNNKIKVMKRRCYGITNIKHLFQRILLDLEGYIRFNAYINVSS